MGGVLLWQKTGCETYTYDQYFCSLVCERKLGDACTESYNLKPGDDVCSPGKEPNLLSFLRSYFIKL